MRYYSTEVPQTAAELFDGELVIAHYGSGLYYSISRGGALVWQGLRHGLSDEATAEWLAGKHSASELATEVSAFIAQLVEHGLVVALDGPVAGPPLPELPATEIGPLTLEKFEYLQELLLLDPVHDVEQAGWPYQANDAE